MPQPPETLPIAGSKASERPILDRLKRMGITAWHEPLLCLPKSFLDFSQVATLKQALPRADVVSESHLFTLVVTEKACIVSQPKKRLILNATDGMLAVKIVVFIHPGIDVAAWKELEEGKKFHVRGSLQNWNGILQMVSPDLIEPRMIGTVVPVYEKRRGVVADGAIYDATRHALEHHFEDTIKNLIASFHGLSEPDILSRARLKAPTIAVILKAAHAPSSEDEGLRGLAAMRRLAALSIVENAKRMKQRCPVPDSVVQIPPALIEELINKLPHPLTGDQKQAIREIVDDMASPLPMRRVVSGDVGSGKTFTIMIPALAVHRLGLRAVILTPNSLLADQFVKECKEYFGQDTNVIAVTSGTKKLDLTSNPILVGTTALLTRLKGEKPPAFFCVDEEQKMSVSQKVELTDLASNYLQATATPIPRTTALITHGAMNVSLIREMPVKKVIKTFIVTAGESRRLYEHTRNVLDAGGQVAIVYPIVDDEEQEKRSVVAAFADWDRRFPGLVGMVHGQMKEQEKLDAVAALKSGQKRIAIVSSVIEIGLTLGELRSLIVVNAERYGTSTLHQLRGRVARRGGTGYFFMFLPETVKPEAMQRLQLVVDHADGFTLSEKDAELRGYGDLFEDAERQSGNSRSTVFRCIDLTPTEIHAAASLEAKAA
jgi:ATP-dependent DNA helicase RecG